MMELWNYETCVVGLIKINDREKYEVGGGVQAEHNKVIKFKIV